MSRIAVAHWPLAFSQHIFHCVTHLGRVNTNLPFPSSNAGCNVTPNKLSTHLSKNHYGNFWLTDAVRPSLAQAVIPQEGYRIATYRDAVAGFAVPVLVASVSRERLFDLFLDLLDPLGEEVDVVLETSHHGNGRSHQDLFRDNIDLPVLKSHCCDFEDLLINDGCAGIAVLSTVGPMEVQFDEHKLLIVYAPELTAFTDIARQYGIKHNDSLMVISEGEHLHSTEPRFLPVFDQFCLRLGVGEPVQGVSR